MNVVLNLVVFNLPTALLVYAGVAKKTIRFENGCILAHEAHWGWPTSKRIPIVSIRKIQIASGWVKRIAIHYGDNDSYRLGEVNYTLRNRNLFLQYLYVHHDLSRAEIDFNLGPWDINAIEKGRIFYNVHKGVNPGDWPHLIKRMEDTIAHLDDPYEVLRHEATLGFAWHAVSDKGHAVNMCSRTRDAILDLDGDLKNNKTHISEDRTTLTMAMLCLAETFMALGEETDARDAFGFLHRTIPRTKCAWYPFLPRLLHGLIQLDDLDAARDVAGRIEIDKVEELKSNESFDEDIVLVLTMIMELPIREGDCEAAREAADRYLASHQRLQISDWSEGIRDIIDRSDEKAFPILHDVVKHLITNMNREVDRIDILSCMNARWPSQSMADPDDLLESFLRIRKKIKPNDRRVRILADLGCVYKNQGRKDDVLRIKELLERYIHNASYYRIYGILRDKMLNLGLLDSMEAHLEKCADVSYGNKSLDEYPIDIVEIRWRRSRKDEAWALWCHEVGKLSRIDEWGLDTTEYFQRLHDLWCIVRDMLHGTGQAVS